MSSWREAKDSLDFPLCPRSIEAPSFLQGELDPEERARFESHLANCPDCLREVHEAGAVLALLRAIPSAPRGCDLVPGILNRLGGMEGAERAAGAGRRRPVAARVAATSVLAILAGGFVVGGFGDTGSPPAAPRGPHFAAGAAGATGQIRAQKVAGGREAALERGLAWLLRAQEPSGGWSASRWGGQPAYDVGLSGLALLAILNADPGTGPETGPVKLGREALARAVAFMKDQQASDGRFGPLFPGALYNHAIATVALLEALAREGDRSLRPPIERALRFLCRSQLPDGGWGYLGCVSEAANTAMTCWPLQGLVLARGLGFGGLDSAIRGGLRHLARVCDESGRSGYRRAGDFLHGPEALSSMSAFCVLLAKDRSIFPQPVRSRLLDRIERARAVSADRNFYRDFFVLSAADAISPGGRRRLPPEAVEDLASEQVSSGPNRGSWDPSDLWSATGGRVYSTALATLILQVESRGKRLASWIGGEE